MCLCMDVAGEKSTFFIFYYFEKKRHGCRSTCVLFQTCACNRPAFFRGLLLLFPFLESLFFHRLQPINVVHCDTPESVMFPSSQAVTQQKPEYVSNKHFYFYMPNFSFFHLPAEEQEEGRERSSHDGEAKISGGRPVAKVRHFVFWTLLVFSQKKELKSAKANEQTAKFFRKSHMRRKICYINPRFLSRARFTNWRNLLNNKERKHRAMNPRGNCADCEFHVNFSSQDRSIIFKNKTTIRTSTVDSKVIWKRVLLRTKCISRVCSHYTNIISIAHFNHHAKLHSLHLSVSSHRFFHMTSVKSMTS